MASLFLSLACHNGRPVVMPDPCLTMTPTSDEQLVIEANRNDLAQINELSKTISRVQQEIEDLYREYAG
jgi:hypothetical protein